jgi:hypothetical protein
MPGTNCEDDSVSLLDKLHLFLKPSNASSTCPSTSHGSEAIGSVSDKFIYIVHIGKEVQCGVSGAERACDVKLFPVAYVGGFIAKCLLSNNRLTYVKYVWYLKCHHHLISMQDSRSTAVQFSLLLIELRSWWRLLVLL